MRVRILTDEMPDFPHDAQEAAGAGRAGGYVDRLGEDGQVEFKGKAKVFCWTYDFLSSVIPYSNPGWEKFSIFLNLLTPKLPAPKEEAKAGMHPQRLRLPSKCRGNQRLGSWPRRAARPTPFCPEIGRMVSRHFAVGFFRRRLRRFGVLGSRTLAKDLPLRSQPVVNVVAGLAAAFAISEVRAQLNLLSPNFVCCLRPGFSV